MQVQGECNKWASSSYQNTSKVGVLTKAKHGLAGNHSLLQGSELFTYLPVFWALFCYSHCIIQSDNASGLLQVLYAASESRCRNVKPDLGMQEKEEMDQVQAWWGIAAEIWHSFPTASHPWTSTCFMVISSHWISRLLILWCWENLYFHSVWFAFSVLKRNTIMLTEE